MNFPYEDIVNLPHHISKRHTPMSRQDRAAQFAPFAALTGHDEAVKETARLTDEETELSDDDTNVLNRRHNILLEHIDEQPEVTFVYFEPDVRKSGGAYKIKVGNVKKIDEYGHVYILTDGTQIPMKHLFSMECEMFGNQEE